MFHYVLRFDQANEPDNRGWRTNDAAALSRSPQCLKEPNLIPGQIDGHARACGPVEPLGIGISGAQPFSLSAGYYINQCRRLGAQRAFYRKTDLNVPLVMGRNAFDAF